MDQQAGTVPDRDIMSNKVGDHPWMHVLCTACIHHRVDVTLFDKYICVCKSHQRACFIFRLCVLECAGKKIFLVQHSRTQRKILIVNACFRDISYRMGAYLAWQSCWISGSAKDGNGISSVHDALVVILVVTTVSNDLERELGK
jgi:hypothetical protein